MKLNWRILNLNIVYVVALGLTNLVSAADDPGSSAGPSNAACFVNLGKLVADPAVGLDQQKDSLSRQLTANSAVVVAGAEYSGKTTLIASVLNADSNVRAEVLNWRQLAAETPPTASLTERKHPSAIITQIIESSLKDEGKTVVIIVPEADALFQASSDVTGVSTLPIRGEILKNLNANNPRVKFIFESRRPGVLEKIPDIKRAVGGAKQEIKVEKLDDGAQKEALIEFILAANERNASNVISLDALDDLFRLGKILNGEFALDGAKTLINDALARIEVGAKPGYEPLAIAKKRAEILTLRRRIDTLSKLPAKSLSRADIPNIEAQISRLNDELSVLDARYTNEKSIAAAIKQRAEEIAKIEGQIEKLEDSTDSAKLAELLKLRSELQLAKGELEKSEEELNTLQNNNPLHAWRVDRGLLTLIAKEKTGKNIGNTTDQTELLFGAADRVAEGIVGTSQRRAINEILRQYRGRVLSGNPKPLGVRLYGPTGTGKTTIALALARELFPGEDDAFEVIPLNQFMHSFSVSKIQGSPPGYVGYEEPGIMPYVIMRRGGKGFVLVYDEVEKAHPDVARLLMTFDDKGEFQDSKGVTHKAANVLIVGTSNEADKTIERYMQENLALVREGRDKYGYTYTPEQEAQIKGLNEFQRMKILEEIRAHAEGAVWARTFDRFLLEPIDNPKQLVEEKFVQLLVKTELFKNMGIKNVTLDPALLPILAERAFSPFLGGRGTENYVENHFLSPVVERLNPRLPVAERLANGDQIAFVLEGENVVMKIKNKDGSDKSSVDLFKHRETPYVDYRLTPLYLNKIAGGGGGGNIKSAESAEVNQTSPPEGLDPALGLNPDEVIPLPPLNRSVPPATAPTEGEPKTQDSGKRP